MDTLRLRRSTMSGGGGKYIKFKDPAVEAICIANWSSDGIGLTYEDAAAVTWRAISKFEGNTEITSFDELRYFIGLDRLPGSNSSGVFRNCANLRSVILPPNVTEIQNSVFSGCSNLVSIGDMSKVTSIGRSAFYNCTSLNAELDFSSITYIGAEAFQYAPLTGILNAPNLAGSINGVFFKSRITEIRSLGNCSELNYGAYSSGCFQDNPRLTKAYLPATLTKIWRNCFSGCSALREVTLPGASMCVLHETNAFNGCTSLAHIYVPAELVETYKADSVWATYASKIEAIPNN